MHKTTHHSRNDSLNLTTQPSQARGEKIVQAAFDELDQSIPTQMPILEAFLDRQGKRLPLERVTALLIQHQLGNHVPQAQALLRLGLKPENLIWLDVPYTSNATVRTALEALGIPRKNLKVHDYEVLQPYAPYQLRRTQTIYRELLANPPEHLLVLDDGAYFLEAICTMKSRLPRVSVVEQTTRGLIKIEESALLQSCAKTFPIVNVARSRPKMTLEPPFIGRAISGALVRRVKSFPQCLSGPALVLGFGAIGSRVAESLAGCMNEKRELVYIHDTDPARREQARANGFSLWDRNNFDTRFRLVIGCSGRASFTVGDMIYLENDAVLASASSGSVELSRQEFIDLADSSDLDDVMVLRDGLEERNIHSDIRLQLVERTATFLNGGFPLNFDGRINCVPARYIQPTVTMMVAAAVQAVSSNERYFVELKPDFCKWLEEAFRAELGDEAVVLGAECAA